MSFYGTHRSSPGLAALLRPVEYHAPVSTHARPDRGGGGGGGGSMRESQRPAGLSLRHRRLLQHEARYASAGGSNFLCAMRYASSQQQRSQTSLRLKTTWPERASSSLESLASSASQPVPPQAATAPMASTVASTMFFAAATSTVV